MGEGRHPADGVAGDAAYLVGVGPLAPGCAGLGGEGVRVDHVGAAGEGDDELAVDVEHERLHDLADLAPDSGGGVGGGSGSVGVLDHLEVDTGRSCGSEDPAHGLGRFAHRGARQMPTLRGSSEMATAPSSPTRWAVP